jgi:exoribonuclease R
MQQIKKKIRSRSPKRTINGIFHASERGYGFVTPDVEEGAARICDIFIGSDKTAGAFDRDRVSVKLKSSRRGGTGGKIEVS